MKSQQTEPQVNKLLYALVIYDTKNNDVDLDKATKNILDLNYPADKLKIIINSISRKDKDHNRYVNMTNILLNKFHHTRLVFNNEDCKTNEIDFNGFSKCYGANYLVKMNIDQIIDSEYFNKVNDIVEKLDGSILTIENITAIPYSVVSKNYLAFNDYETMESMVIEQSKLNNLFQEIT